MKKKAKVKTAKVDLADLMTAVVRIAERLEVLEKKADLLISQTSPRSFGGQQAPKPAQQPFVPPQSFQPAPVQRPNETKPAQGQPHGQPQARRERILHKAVCADCHKDCEVPFKPTGERPVYCKECFSKRKSSHSLKTNHGNKPVASVPVAAGPMNPPHRQVVVTKKGVGKVTVSEIVHSSSSDHASKRKIHKPSKKSKR
jgi:CxxC-x17-CxxC domain-containing protein